MNASDLLACLHVCSINVANFLTSSFASSASSVMMSGRPPHRNSWHWCSSADKHLKRATALQSCGFDVTQQQSNKQRYILFFYYWVTAVADSSFRVNECAVFYCYVSVQQTAEKCNQRLWLSFPICKCTVTVQLKHEQ